MYNEWEKVFNHTIINTWIKNWNRQYKTKCNICEWIANKFYNTLESCKLCKARSRKIIDKWNYYELELTWWEFTKIDKENFEWIRNKCWYKSKRWSVETRGVKKLIKLHRIIMDAPIWKVVDHINWDILDNRKSNLRVCTIQENCMNKTASQNSKSWIKWVRLDNRRNKYCVQISLKWKRYWGWEYKDLEDAIISVNNLTKKLHWEFAKQQ